MLNNKYIKKGGSFIKKNFVLIISFILILTILALMFSVFSMSVAASVTIKDKPVPLDSGVVDDLGTEEETTIVNPKTGDKMLSLIILASMSLTILSISTVVCTIKKSRAK